MKEVIKANMQLHDSLLSPYACKSSAAVRQKKQQDDDIRTDFFRDIDRIIHSLSYTRYIDKTQVYTFMDNDNISRRMVHVQLVSKIARTIGRALCLNEDLIEAAALGHDLGHVPFGHAGEAILNELSLKYGEGYFNHNIQSVRNLMFVENGGKGHNLTLQVLDGIMCHNGEMEFIEYHPVNKTFDAFLRQYEDCYNSKETIKKLVPMTLEGCVVRISDIIAYVGRDIEDAIRLNNLSKEQLPKEITDVLGSNNRDIVNSLIMNIIENSLGKNYIGMSPEVFEALVNLKKFNYKEIYLKANTEEQLSKYNEMFEVVFEGCLNALKNKDTSKRIYQVFLNEMDDNYLEKTSDVRKVIDYIAGMTDDFLESEYKEFFKGIIIDK